MACAAREARGARPIWGFSRIFHFFVEFVFYTILTPNRYHSTSFVKTSAPGGFPSSGTAVLTDFLKNHPKKQQQQQQKQCAALPRAAVLLGKQAIDGDSQQVGQMAPSCLLGVLFFIFGVFFSRNRSNGRPGGREPPRSISFDETSRMISV